MNDLHAGEWLERNRANWDERVPLHVASEFYDQSPLRAGRGRLYPIEEAELSELYPDGLSGLRILHLQCHFGADTLTLAQRGATVVGLDFSAPAIEQARALAAEVGLESRASFVQANIYDAREALPEAGSFDLVFTTWGTIGWLPDVAEWARIIAWFLKPGGQLYFADGHPAAFVFSDLGETSGLPVFAYAYEADGAADVIDENADYAADDVDMTNTITHEWAHPLSETIGALLAAGLRLDFFSEHYEVPWRMYQTLEPVGNGLWRWPETKWLPLTMSLGATRIG
ncbi:bifunctional 2-polyprenyl-6-hydroxyphenol methylase/3-demethylubiquinol 3-O-methyltransferase UbiG [Glaciihabitans sp. dw_435]|uniref:class I SAM-dependent methyltransferase n=1 Tax=Glaciihabitans sp. dw_435 TaxID=2720081 RepID=UPI001BD51F3F|nr:class I SAM-dependent methyltransferase [Glaciihabitans sp. dw_435]